MILTPSRVTPVRSARRGAIPKPTLFGLVLGCLVCSISTAQPQQDRTPKLGAQEFVRVLDDEEWHLHDARIQSLLVNGDPSSAARVENAIAVGELSAIQMYIDAVSSPTDRFAGLVRWTGHHNGGVAALAANQILQDGHWDQTGAISRHMRTWDLDTQIQFVQKLLIHEPRDEILIFARSLGTNLLQRAISPVRGGAGAALISRLMARSFGRPDRVLLEHLAERYPNEPFVWVALSRGEPSDPLVNQARTIYEGEGTEGLRAAAGLILAKEEPTVYDQLVNWIMVYLSEFASPKFVATIASARERPLDPSTREMYERLLGNQPLLAVLRELPDDVLRRNADALFGLHHGTAGLCTATILAKRTPSALVMYWKTSGKSVPPELHKAISLAAQLEASLETDVADLLPEVSRSDLQRRSNIANRVLFGVCMNMTAWD